MRTLLPKLQKDYPALRFRAGKQFCWSPESGEVMFREDAKGPKAAWSLLHETGHALLGHTSYKADFELIRMEVAAWDKARELALHYGISIDDDHIEDCLDTYRDWLYRRSICPNCTAKSLQQDDYIHYRCFNCHTVWRVSSNRFGRAYRRSKDVARTPALFHTELT